jgi:adenosylcobinamide kinase / adenosylcobinamide-phosphate guanylyltransferase
MSIHLILGGARSGKSAYAEKLAIESGLPVTYIATAQVYDDEFKQRVQHHKDRRPKNWQLIETAHFLSAALKYTDLEANIHAASGASETSPSKHCIIIDCLTLWLAQCICPECAPSEGVNWANERAQFLEFLPKVSGDIILVSNEVGMGIVPLGKINRQFQDEQGRLNQAIAAIADKVTFVAAGLPLTLKG